MKKIYSPHPPKNNAVSTIERSILFYLLCIAILLLQVSNIQAQVVQVHNSPRPLYSDQLQTEAPGVTQNDAGVGLTINGCRKDEVQYIVNGHRLNLDSILSQSTASASSISGVTGKIVDERGEEMIGAVVMILDSQGKSTGKSVCTDFDGNYELGLAPGSYDIRVSYVSYETQITQRILVAKNKFTFADFRMKQWEQEENMCVTYYYCCGFAKKEEEKRKPEDEATPLRAYPVPLSASITVEYNLKTPEEVSISLSDMDGHIVSVMMEQQVLEEGAHKEAFSLPAALPLGIYFINIKKASGHQILKVVK